jgi:hypothetical protein
MGGPIEHDDMRRARGCLGDDLRDPVPVQVGQGDVDPAGVGGLEGADLVNLRPGVTVEQADERGRAHEEPMANELAAGARHSSRRSIAGRTAGVCRTLLPGWMRTQTNSHSRDENIKSL